MAKTSWFYAALTACAMVGCSHNDTKTTTPQPSAAQQTPESGDIQRVRGTDETQPTQIPSSQYPSDTTSPGTTPPDTTNPSTSPEDTTKPSPMPNDTTTPSPTPTQPPITEPTPAPNPNGNPTSPTPR